MNQLETMNFVDKATPQQLTAMVNARDPFSYMALSKLQQIRDERMKAQAGQPAPAPLAQVIPQQVMQGAPQMPPQMPQSMEQPPQMGIASLGGIGPDQEAAGAGGGMVAFTQGGGIKGYADGVLVEGDQSSMGLEMGSINPPEPKVKPTAAEVDIILEDLRKRGIPIGLGTFKDIERGDYSVLPTAPKPLVPTPKKETVPASVDPSTPEAKKPFALIPVGDRTGIKSAGLGFDPAIQSQKFLDEAGELGNRFAGLAGNTPERTQAVGDIRAATETEYQNRKTKFADPMAKYMTEIQGERAALDKNKDSIQNQSLLTLAMGMMNPTVRGGQGLSGLAQVIGEAGPKALGEFQKLKTLDDEKRSKLRNLEMTVAASQEARDRGMYDQAQNLALNERAQRMDLYKTDLNLAVQGIQAGTQIKLYQSKIPFEKADVILKQQNLAIQAAIANKPQEYEQKVLLANKIGAATKTDPALILREMILGSVEGKEKERAMSTAATLIKTMPIGMSGTTQEVAEATAQLATQLYNAMKPASADALTPAASGQMVTKNGVTQWVPNPKKPN